MKKLTRHDVDELRIYDDIKTIIMEEVAILKKGKDRDESDFKNLFLLARTYAILKDDLRGDIKGDTLGHFGVNLDGEEGEDS